MFNFASQLKSFHLSQGKTSLKLIGLILLIALFFIGLVWLGGWGVKKDNRRKEKVAQKELSATAKELKFQAQAANLVKTKDFTQCEKISDATYQAVCINNIALNLAKETQDISYCQKIDDKLIPQADCERQVVFAKSLAKEDIGVCKETSKAEIQKQCEVSFYSQLALKKNDIKVCDKTSDKDKADFCYNNFLVKKDFVPNSKDFNCSRLKGKNEQTDCKILKEIRAVGMRQERCRTLRSVIFVPYCFSQAHF